jgi:hypothetical protein
MSKRKTIQQVDARMTALVIRIARDANELNELRVTRRKMVAGKIKVAPPPGVKHAINQGYTKTRDFTADEFGDLIPSFGPSGGRQ